MKKLILLFVITFMACPNDDDTPPPAQDPLIGTWKYTAFIENGVSQTLEPCEEEDTLIFTAEENYTATLYDINPQDECVVVLELAGTWANIGDSNYAITQAGETETLPIVFDGNTFYLEETDNGGTPDDPSDDITYRDVYTRQ